MLNWFRKKTPALPLPTTDIHSHLLPGLDDGVKSMEEAYAIVLFFEKLGYKKLVTTPHVMSDIYRNTAEGINHTLTELRSYLAARNCPMIIEAAAEYYLDESLVTALRANQPLLTIANKYLLFETNFLTEPLNLKEFIFLASTKGYQLILAHPERYLYLHKNFDKALDLINRGVQFQVNISSITGYYSKEAQTMAQELIERQWVHWIGSDCHHMTHAKLVLTARDQKYFQKALNLPLLNNTI